MPTKICSKCSKELSINNFTKSKNNKDGLYSYCKECSKMNRKEYYDKNKNSENENSKKNYIDNKENIHEKNKQYRKEHAETLNKKSKQYYEEHKEIIAVRKRQYCGEHKEIISEYKKQYNRSHKEANAKCQKQYQCKNIDAIAEQRKKFYEAHKESIALYSRKYRADNRDLGNIRKQHRRAMKSLLPATLTVEEWGKAKQYFNNKCAYCGEEFPLEREHFIPLSKGGEYTVNNIISACRSCNSCKRDKNFFEWYPKQKYYSKKREFKILKFLNYKNGQQQLKIL